MDSPRVGHRVELKAFEPQKHAELLESWLKRPHVMRWWGDQIQGLSTLLLRPPSTHAVIVADSVFVGYLCWGPPVAEELTAAGLTDLPDALVDIDILIGEPQFVGRGIGPLALRLLIDHLRQKAEACWAGLGTSHLNQAALSAFEKAGFRVFSNFDDPEYGPSRYFIIDLRRPDVLWDF